MLDIPVRIIRNGEFGTDFNAKFLLGVFALFVSLYLWKKTKNKDYLCVFLTGTALWSLVEFGIQFVGLREFNPVALFGILIPLPIVAVLRGAAEGGFVAFFGLLIGDLILSKNTRTKGLILLGFSVGVIVFSTIIHALPEKAVGGMVASRRAIFAPSCVAATFFITLASIIWMAWVKKTVRQRAWALLGVMVVTAGIWTLAQWAANLRWVEVLSSGVFVRAPRIVEIGTLLYDVIFEIGFMYIPFFAVPHLFKLLSDSQSLE